MKRLYILLTSIAVILVIFLVPLLAKHIKLSRRLIDIRHAIEPEIGLLVSSQIDSFSDDSGEPMFLIINSPGGRYDAGLDIIQAIEDSQAPVICIVVGEALSTAAVILAACDERYAFPFSQFLIHDLRVRIHNTPVNEASKFIVESQQVHKEMIDFLNERLEGINRKQLVKLSQKGQFFNITEAMKYGLIDDVIESVECRKHSVCRDLVVEKVK